ncbi:f-box domain containing protein [Niveomyces insectorum RCEF 264]|uniref:F-box domain containing protein n=1 Tax=Niveomyces insectorum RCEF 264 TaxID=1081102 RepID=A0A168A3M5_9HYPO|nr:f-box domain containing protein [Niveomyces insectorum RCEF 264]
MASPNLLTLPGELFLHIMSYLEPHDAVQLQLVCKQLRRTGRDGGFWRTRCFDDSQFLASLLRRRRLLGRPEDRHQQPSSSSLPSPPPPPRSHGAAAPAGGSDTGGTAAATARQHAAAERVRIMANWDPTFPGETISWYDEYVQRNAPIAVSWFERPRRGGGGGVPPGNYNNNNNAAANPVEAHGLALYRPDGMEEDTLLAVAPLEDGSVCLWDVNGTLGRRGAVVKQSRPGLLFLGVSAAASMSADHGRLSPQVDFSVTECVSVDSQRHLAFFAVQNRLVEVDLQTLVAVGVEHFPQPITALSAAHPTVPLTVGMDGGLFMHDSRARIVTRTGAGGQGAGAGAGAGADAIVNNVYRTPCAPHPQPGPLCLLHLAWPGSAEETLSDDIYAAGRIPSILHYDRRNLSAVKDAIHSGASLSSLTSIPYPFSALDTSLRREGLLSLAQVEASKAAVGGRTLVACGEYKSKGSLELYGIGPAPSRCSPGTSPGAGRPVPGTEEHYQQNATMKNRQTSSFSKVFSVANHGARLAVSDGAGLIKWFERDGFTEVRRCTIGEDLGGHDGDVADEDEDGDEAAGTAAAGTTSRPSNTLGDDAGDIARKLVPTRSAHRTSGTANSSSGSESGLANNDLLFWTGERLGLVHFSAKPGFQSDDFVQAMQTEEERATEQEGRTYRTTMRHFFDDMRSARYYGLGSILGS